MKLSLHIILFLQLLFACTLSAAETPEETRAIDALISHVESLNDVKFIRNGKDYTSKNAAKFLRAKRNANADKISTASDFIEKVASKSGTTGKPYLIRFKDGKEMPHGQYLKDILKQQ